MGSTPAQTPSIEKAMDGAVAVLTLTHRPYNLIDKALVHAMIDALQWALDQQARAVVLRSGLRHFSAGADLDAMLADTRNSDVLDWDLVDLLNAFDEHPAPIVAAVHGTCVGGGFELALACDLIVAAASTKFGSVEVTVGLQPLMGGVQRVAHRAGAARAKEIALLGRRYDAATLERWNIINRVVADEDLDTAVMVLAQELAHGPSVANTATKRLASLAVSHGIAATDAAMSELQRAIFRSEDFVTGVNSYRENGIGQAAFEGR
ncbi:enoyl-CoA hydratase/isomerase family protein [Arthrobacter sp. NPDC080031]|uniref:enoyl-CoA hydratase/isomerase family protein n=1 Tax=Arthrobacter sp. NPDC080031 TaxID=3155918 RepID=UPI00344BD99E